MITVQLLGGLGNQMFQAAAGIALARRLGTSLAFDLSRYSEKGLRGYALAPFGIEADMLVMQGGPGARVLRLWNRLLGDKLRPPGYSGPVHHESGFAYEPAFEHLRDGTLISGYFQSPRYFAGQEDRIASMFAPEKLASERAFELARDLEGETSVAIHLRRGDYASDPRAAAIHGVLGWDYYDRAVERLRSAVPDARFFVVSDNPAAAREGAARWLGARMLAGANAGDDLFLMSRARHHIIANSSFSWWSAWLDRREGGIRIAPERWFAPGVAKDTRDLIPERWERL